MSPLLQHTANTADAALTPEQEHLLDSGFDTLRRETESLSTPARVDARLMAAFKAHHTRRVAQQRWRNFLGQWFAPGFALAASVGMSAWMVMAPMAQVGVQSASQTMTSFDSSASDSPFIALQSLEQIALEPKPRLIETAVPRMLLASYGVPVNPETAGDSVRAEMLVSANGQPLAMRFVP